MLVLLLCRDLPHGLCPLPQIPSQYFTPSPPGDLLPTGQILSVKGTPYDFTRPVPVRKEYQRANGGPYKGFDLNYVMPDPAGSMEPVWWKPGQNPQASFFLALLWPQTSRCLI